MDQAILEIDHITATMVPVVPDTTANDRLSVADAEPRLYAALTERPADFEGYFIPARRQHIEAVVTYKALTERPANFVDFFVPPRPKSTEGVATYMALKKRPESAVSDIAA